MKTVMEKSKMKRVAENLNISSCRFGAIVLFFILCVSLAEAGTKTWNTTTGDWTNSANWNPTGVPVAGDDVVIPSGSTYKPSMTAGRYPTNGTYSSFTVNSGAIVTCLGDPTVINEASGGTGSNPHGIGVTLVCSNATINGTLSAVGQGFPGSQGPGFYANGGGSYGGKGTITTGPLWQLPLHPALCYGSVSEPTALGSGGHGGEERAGGGAIRLEVEQTLILNGTIDATAAQVPRSGSGGSVWLSASTFEGTGTVRADGGDSAHGSSGGGGRVAIIYTNSTFSGNVSVAGGSGTLLAQPGTLWEPKRFQGMGGSPESPLEVLLTDNFQYYFPDGEVTNYWNLTVSNAWFEVHEGSMVIDDLVVKDGYFGFDRYADSQPWTMAMEMMEITNSINLTGDSVAYLSAQNYTLADIDVGLGSILKLRGDIYAVNEDSGGTVENPHGSGAVVRCANALVNGTISAFSEGFPGMSGPGTGTEIAGAAYGGQGGDPQLTCYGSLTRPSALGSGGATQTSRTGGGVVRMIVEDKLTLNGTIDASALDSKRCGSGGSVWLTVSEIDGEGTISAQGGSSGMSYPSAGGGGRVALCAANNSFTGMFDVKGGIGSTTTETGTVFRCSLPSFASGDPDADVATLKSGFAVNSNDVYVTRTITKWNQTFQWTDDSRNSASNILDNVASYTLIGLPVETDYNIYTNDVMVSSKTNSGLAGTLTISDIALQPEITILVEPLPMGTLMLIR